MRLSALVIAFIAFFSAILIVSHPSWANNSAIAVASASSSTSHSSGGVGSSSSSASHSSTSSSSHVSSASSAVHGTTTKDSSSKSESDKKGRSFFHPFRKREPVEQTALKPPHCWKGNCTVCPPGSHGKAGACVVANTCLSGQAWNGFACGVLYDRFWSNNCQALAAQLDAQRTRMRSLPGDPGDALRYRTLQEQYQQCLRRNRLFSYQAFSDASLYDLP